MGLLESLGLPPSAKRMDTDSRNLTDEARIEQLKRWQKEGKIKGDSSGLREQLRGRRNKPLQREAREKFDEISRQVEAGTVPEVKGLAAAPSDRGVNGSARQRRESAAGSPADAAKSQSVSGAGKKSLGDVLKEHGLNDAERRDFGTWLKKRHKEGDYGAEVPLDSTNRTPDGHDHLYHPDKVKEMLQEYEAETGRRVGTKGRSKPTSSTPTQTTPTAGGGSTPNKVPQRPGANKDVLEGLARVSKKLPIIKTVGRSFRTGIKVYVSNYVQVPLRLVGEFDRALQTIGNVDSALRGNGFVLQQQVSLAHALASATNSQLKAWRDGKYHSMIDQAINVAREIDRADPEGMYGTDALSTFCAGIELDVSQHERDSAGLLSGVRLAIAEVDLGEAIARKLLDDAAFMAAAASTTQGAVVYMAWQDFRKIQDVLGTLPSGLEQHHREVAADLARVRANIIGGMILDESGEE